MRALLLVALATTVACGRSALQTRDGGADLTVSDGSASKVMPGTALQLCDRNGRLGMRVRLDWRGVTCSHTATDSTFDMTVWGDVLFGGTEYPLAAGVSEDAAAFRCDVAGACTIAQKGGISFDVVDERHIEGHYEFIFRDGIEVGWFNVSRCFDGLSNCG